MRATISLTHAEFKHVFHCLDSNPISGRTKIRMRLLGMFLAMAQNTEPLVDPYTGTQWRSRKRHGELRAERAAKGGRS